MFMCSWRRGNPVADASENALRGGIEIDVFEAVKKRHSTLAYEPTSVPEEKLDRILEATRLARVLNAYVASLTRKREAKAVRKGGSICFLRSCDLSLEGLSKHTTARITFPFGRKEIEY
jgi:hypothetical protein